MVGSTPGRLLAPPPSNGPTSSGGGSMDAGLQNMPDVENKSRTVKNNSYASDKAGGWVDGIGMANDLLFGFQRWWVTKAEERISVFAYYKTDNFAISIQSIDVMNPTSGEISVTSIVFTDYEVRQGPSIRPKDNRLYGFPPVIQANSTTTINLIPSGYEKNPENKFLYGQTVEMYIAMNDPDTKLYYSPIFGKVR
jgi:hypothetical protein